MKLDNTVRSKHVEEIIFHQRANLPDDACDCGTKNTSKWREKDRKRAFWHHTDQFEGETWWLSSRGGWAVRTAEGHPFEQANFHSMEENIPGVLNQKHRTNINIYAKLSLLFSAAIYRWRIDFMRNVANVLGNLENRSEYRWFLYENNSR